MYVLKPSKYFPNALSTVFGKKITKKEIFNSVIVGVKLFGDC